jgi:hypothetical protein
MSGIHRSQLAGSARDIPPHPSFASGDPENCSGFDWAAGARPAGSRLCGETRFPRGGVRCLLQKIRDEPLQETRQETDDHHDLRCRGVVAEVHISNGQALQEITIDAQQTLAVIVIPSA